MARNTVFKSLLKLPSEQLQNDSNLNHVLKNPLHEGNILARISLPDIHMFRYM